MEYVIVAALVVLVVGAGIGALMTRAARADESPAAPAGTGELMTSEMPHPDPRPPGPSPGPDPVPPAPTPEPGPLPPDSNPRPI